MLTIKKIFNIIGGELKDAHNKEANEINDFETIYKFVNSKNAYFLLTKKHGQENQEEIKCFRW